MRMVKMKSSFMVGILSLLFTLPFLGALRAGSILDVAKPYLGEYECIQAELDGKDMLQDYVFIRLDLKGDNTFLLQCKAKGGEIKKENGYYQYNENSNSITMQLQSFRFFKREFPLDKGILTIELPVGGKNILLKFKQR